MFTATIGDYNHRTAPVFQPQPRSWAPKVDGLAARETEAAGDARGQSHGKRKAGEASLSGQPKDPTHELMVEILGRTKETA